MKQGRSKGKHLFGCWFGLAGFFVGFGVFVTSVVTGAGQSVVETGFTPPFASGCSKARSAGRLAGESASLCWRQGAGQWKGVRCMPRIGRHLGKAYLDLRRLVE